jgi:flavin reductase (DIM6/NTAB) family NADH-FMN oxidoreductase RutF
LTLAERKYIDPALIDKASVYRLMTSAIVPRPIAWVGTTNGTASAVDDPTGDNLAPFSYFMGVSSAPPLLALSVARGRAGTLKHTARNILATSCFSVSIPSLSDLTAMHETGGEWLGSEFEAVGVSRAAGTRIRAPRPANALFTMECELHHALDLESTHLFVGRVVLFSAAAGVLRGLEVDASVLAPIARLGGDAYAEIGTLHHLARTAVQDVARGAPRSEG